MPTYFFKNEHHTLACVLREALEQVCDDTDFVSCTLLHPLDEHIEVQVPSEKLLRAAFLNIIERLKTIRSEVQKNS